MGKILTLTLSLLSAVALFTACNSTGCIGNRNSIPLAGFYSAATDRSVSVSGLNIMGLGAPNDSLLYTSSMTLQQVYLPLRAKDESTTYVLTFTTGGEVAAVDEITFYYTSTPWLQSEDCGAMYRYNIENVEYTTRAIDRVEVLDPLVTSYDVETIRIYLRDNSQQEGGEE